MNVSLPFASPARKQDTTNNNKKGQPHDTWKKPQKLISVPVCLFRTLEYLNLINYCFKLTKVG